MSEASGISNNVVDLVKARTAFSETDKLIEFINNKDNITKVNQVLAIAQCAFDEIFNRKTDDPEAELALISEAIWCMLCSENDLVHPLKKVADTVFAEMGDSYDSTN